jgi:hypothetical protein
MKTSLCVCCLAALAACASTKAEEQKPATTSQAVTAQDLPVAGLPEGGFISMDERGAYGPVTVAHVDVMADGTLRCFRRQQKRPDASKTLVLTEAERLSLAEALLKADTYAAVPQARQGTISDVGTTTLTVAPPSGNKVVLVMDGSNTVSPSQGEVMALLSAWMLRCVEQP